MLLYCVDLQANPEKMAHQEEWARQEARANQVRMARREIPAHLGVREKMAPQEIQGEMAETEGTDPKEAEVLIIKRKKRYCRGTEPCF